MSVRIAWPISIPRPTSWASAAKKSATVGKMVAERPGRHTRQHIVEGGGHRFLFTRACEMAEIVADFLDNGASKANRQLRRSIPL